MYAAAGALACVWSIVFGIRSSAEQARGGTKTTMQGVYTPAQASSGQRTYDSICLACHPLVTQTGRLFAKRWRGQTLADLYGYVAESMPKNDPGSLTPREIAHVIAYLLKINGLPAGKAELPANEATLKAIRIELPVK